MSEKDDGGYAFPSDRFGATGMTLRDWFAGQVVAGIGSLRISSAYEITPAGLARGAYAIADAMLEARKVSS